MNMNNNLVTLATLMTLAASSSLAQANEAVDNYPEETLNYIVAFGPGGGNNLMSRTLVDIINQYGLYPEQDIVVENRAGGSGAIGFGFVSRQEGSPYYATSTSGNFISTPLISDTDWDYSDFTPVGLLASDAMFLVVPADSEYQTVEDFADAASSQTLLVGGTGSAGPSRVVASLFAKEANIDFEYLPAGTGGEMVTALTSDSVHAIVANPSEVSGQMAAGNFRALAYSDSDRSSVYPDIPTFVEEGFDFTFSLPRGVVLPANLPEGIQEWWVDALKQAVETREWYEYLETNSLSGNYIWGEEFGDYLKSTSDVYEEILREVGAIN